MRSDYSRLSKNGNPVSRHHYTAGGRAYVSPRGRRAGASLGRFEDRQRRGIDARGSILGGAIAHQVSAGFVPIRKKGKLPHATVRIAYALEYGIGEMEMHVDAIHPGERVILVDDLIATGATAESALKLLRQIGANVVAACFIIDLPDLGGAAKLHAMDVPVRALMTFERHRASNPISPRAATSREDR
jgi:adenine phosphoribosyltransferase